MKKILLLIAIFIGSVNLSAQTDASWKETCEFINKYSSHIKYSLSWYLGEENEFSKLKINNYELSYYRYKTTPIKADLSKLLNVTENVIPQKDGIRGGTNIKIQLTGNYFLYGTKGSDSYSEGSVFYLQVSDVEMQLRVLKAFQHLKNLAIKKRKDLIKASGDKF
jgi:hypothetical protein